MAEGDTQQRFVRSVYRVSQRGGEREQYNLKSEKRDGLLIVAKICCRLFDVVESAANSTVASLASLIVDVNLAAILLSFADERPDFNSHFLRWQPTALQVKIHPAFATMFDDLQHI